jgi:SpoVK/Ycf46/Vps4 family AAA+-type ATPase
MVWIPRVEEVTWSSINKRLGPPGVGKTMTAEALAKSCGKPLLTVGIGDLGTSPGFVEQSLSKLFNVVTAWHGILLM